jgi:hypothetical protein
VKLLVPHAFDLLDDVGPIDRIILAAAGHMLAQQLRLSERNGVVVYRAAAGRLAGSGLAFLSRCAFGRPRC